MTPVATTTPTSGRIFVFYDFGFLWFYLCNYMYLFIGFKPSTKTALEYCRPVDASHNIVAKSEKILRATEQSKLRLVPYIKVQLCECVNQTLEAFVAVSHL